MFTSSGALFGRFEGGVAGVLSVLFVFVYLFGFISVVFVFVVGVCFLVVVLCFAVFVLLLCVCFGRVAQNRMIWPPPWGALVSLFPIVLCSVFCLSSV